MGSSEFSLGYTTPLATLFYLISIWLGPYFFSLSDGYCQHDSQASERAQVAGLTSDLLQKVGWLSSMRLSVDLSAGVECGSLNGLQVLVVFP